MVLKIIVLIEIFVRVLTILAQMKKRTPLEALRNALYKCSTYLLIKKIGYVFNAVFCNRL